MMTGNIHIWMLVLVCMAHLLDASWIERQVPNKRLSKRSKPASSQTTEEELNKVCGISKSKAPEKGSNAVLGQFPWMAAIFFNKQFAYVTCGGALISDLYVLTSAGCVIIWETGQKRNASDFTVRLGDLDFTTDTDKATPVDFKVVELIPHKEYNSTSYQNDIALMKLEKAAQFSDFITPICLRTPSQMMSDVSSYKMIVAGWGTDAVLKQPAVLQFVEVNVISNSECQRRLSEFKYNVSDSELCAVEQLGGKVVCYGDGGGPLMLHNPKDSRWYSIGLVSGSRECGKYPVIYTRTNYYLDWIVNTVKTANIN